MQARSIIVLTGVWIGVGFAAMAPAAAQTYSPEQQQLCSGDAFRLCGLEIPDVDRVTACMIRQRAQLSPGCQSVFRPVQVAAPARVERPMSVKPKSVRATQTASKTGKVAKVAKSRKPKTSAN